MKKDVDIAVSDARDITVTYARLTLNPEKTLGLNYCVTSSWEH
jgi:hypothetical protein